ncbi:nuclear transport factor 2 family protein [Psychroserpens sp. MEBiC05023]
MLKPIIKTLAILSVIFLLSSCNDDSKEASLKEENNSLNSQISKLKEQQDILEKNKEVVTSFYQEFFGDFNFDAANTYIGDTYVQHNPAVADGKRALVDAAKVWFKDAPKKKINFNLVIAENDLVFVQIIDERDGNRFSTMDVFRVTNGKISEHWDAFATFKKNAVSQNENPLF